MPPEQKPDPVDVFRDLLEGLCDIAQSLQPSVSSVPDLLGVLELARVNDGLLALLMEKVREHRQRQSAGGKR